MNTNTPQKPTPPAKWLRLFAVVTEPTVDDAAMENYRHKVIETQEMEKLKKEKRRFRREKMKNRQKEKLAELAGKKHPTAHPHDAARARTQPMLYQKGVRGTFHSLEDDETSLSPSHSDVSVDNSSKTGGSANLSNKEEARYKMFLTQSSGPSHFAAQDAEQDLVKKYKENRKRRISQLYTGEVYHHELTYIWDRLKNRSKFYDKLDEMTRMKFPITDEIAKKLDKIKKKQEKTEVRKQKVENGAENVVKRKARKVGNRFLRMFQNTNIGYVFKTTPRYYKMTPVVPIHCRRCRYLLNDTLEARWTPHGVAFAILFPVVGLLCCLSYREFVCVVCEEIYIYGDYPSRCRPLDKTKLASDAHVRIKRRSFNKDGQKN